MSRYLGSACKLCRREGTKLMLKGERCSSSKCALARRNFPPGFHGPQGRPRQSEYSLQLREKQKVKRMYGLLEQQFHLTFLNAKKQSGDAGENLLRLLEMRLDNVVYRAGFADSRAKARELVSHAHFTVNGHPVDIPSYRVKPGDIIKVKASRRRNQIFNGLGERLLKKKFQAPGWLFLDPSELEVKVLHEPKEEDLEKNINTQLIVEFYAR